MVFSRVRYFAGLPLACLSVLGVSLFVAPIAAVAQTPSAPRVRYIPNKKRPLPRRTEAAGTRGCTMEEQQIQVSLLVPGVSLPQTQESHPTFSWHVSNPQKAEVAVQFSLVEPGQIQPMYRQQVTTDKTGLVQLKLPNQVAGLEVGKQYRWTVSWGCNVRRPSEQMYQRAWIERTALSSAQQQRLNEAKTDLDRVAVFAQSGIWYEAIGLAAAKSTDSQMKPYWQTLLEDGGLTYIQQAEQLANVPQ
jgi:hypothetical protein